MFVKVKVFPDAKHDNVEKISSDTFHIYVRSSPKHSAANRHVLLLLGDHYQVPATSLRIIKGSRMRNKIIDVPV